MIPGLTPCYQCFIKGVPDVASDVEVSSVSDAQRIAYSDRIVTPEPGLSTDIVPVALFMAKLALIELTEPGTPAFYFRQDLIAPWQLLAQSPRGRHRLRAVAATRGGDGWRQRSAVVRSVARARRALPGLRDQRGSPLR